MEYAAICHFADNRYCFPLEKGRFLLRLRVKKGDMRRVVLHYQDKYLPLARMDTRQAVEMTLAARDRVSDYYEAVICFRMVCLRYWFEMEDGSGRRAYYGNYQFFSQPVTDLERMFDCPQNLREEEMFQTPDWAANRVVYQIFPASFAPTGPVGEGWYAPVDHRVDLGGTFRGILEHLDHLHRLGVDVLYMTPVFRANTPHRYDTVDYYAVDPALGTQEELRSLVDQAHRLGMRVLLDGVFNHTSQKFFAFADILEKGADSPYRDWYYIEGFPLRMAWGEKPNFQTFSYFGGMPKLNLRNPAVENYILEVGRYWIRTCDIDGWRLDVADEVGHAFWRHFREAIKAEKPEALLVGEEWHFAGDFLTGDQWDTVMNYPFYNSLLDLLRGRETVTEFFEDLGFLRGNLHPRVYPLLWNLMGSHDTPRFLHMVAGDRAKRKLAAALQLLLPGMPMIYYGDEYAMEGGDQGDSRRGMVWDPDRQDRAMFRWYQRLIAVRHGHPGLTQGEVTAFRTEDPVGLGVLTRRWQGETLTLAIHCAEGTVPLPEYRGKHNLLTDAPFPGALAPWEAAVLL